MIPGDCTVIGKQLPALCTGIPDQNGRWIAVIATRSRVTFTGRKLNEGLGYDLQSSQTHIAGIQDEELLRVPRQEKGNARTFPHRVNHTWGNRGTLKLPTSLGQWSMGLKARTRIHVLDRSWTARALNALVMLVMGVEAGVGVSPDTEPVGHCLSTQLWDEFPWRHLNCSLEN
jgi:hypothetical protein